MAAMSTWSFCAILLSQASAGPYDVDSYLENYYAKYVNQYASDYAGDYERKYAGHHERDYAPQARTGHEYEDRYTGESDHHSHGKSHALLELLSDPVKHMGSSSADDNAEGMMAKASSAQREAFKRAESTIAKIWVWDAELKADLKNRSSAVVVAKGIVTNVRDSFFSRRKAYEHRFDSALRVLDPETLATANSSEFEKAADAARKVEKEFEHLDHAEAKALRSELHAFEEDGKAKARLLHKEARQAARRFYWLGMDSAKAQRRAGGQEFRYERAEDETEDASERLLSHAEAAAERAEGHVEELSSKIENHLEKLVDRVQQFLQRVRESRKQRLHHAVDLVYKAREEACRRGPCVEARMQERSVRGEAAQERTAPEEAAPGKAAHEKDSQHGPGEEERGTGEATSRPTAFLAQTPSQDLGSTIHVLALCASMAMLAAVPALLVFYQCWSATAIQHPLLLG